MVESEDQMSRFFPAQNPTSGSFNGSIPRVTQPPRAVRPPVIESGRASTGPSALSAPGDNVNPIQQVGSICLFLLLFCSLSRVTDFFLVPLHIPFVLSACCLVMAVASMNALAAFKSRIGMAMGLFSLWLVFAVPGSMWRGGSFAEVFDDWSKSFGLFLVTVALISSVKQSSRLMRVMAWAFLATAILGFFYGKSSDGRFALERGLYSGSNELGAAMVQGCVCWWFMIHNPKASGVKRVLSPLALIPLFLILLNTASRAGIITLAVLMVVVFFRYSMMGKMVFITMVMVGVIAGLALTPASAKRRLATIFSNSNEPAGQTDEAIGSSAQRVYLFKRSVELTFEHPLFGVGPGQFVVAENGQAASEGKRGQWRGTHNTYTQVSSEAGIPALLFFAASLYYCWKELRLAETILKAARLPDSDEYLTVAFTLRLALVSYIVFFCFEHIAYACFYPVLAGFIAAFTQAVRNLAPRMAPAVEPSGRRVLPGSFAFESGSIGMPSKRFEGGRPAQK